MGDGDHKEGLKAGGGMAGPAASWRLNVSDFQMPERPKEPPFVTRVFLRSHGTAPAPSTRSDPLICLHAHNYSMSAIHIQFDRQIKMALVIVAG